MTKLAAFALLAATAAACGAPDDVLTGQNETDLIQANAATDDKSVTTPTAAWVYTGVSAAFITQQINALGARLTNLEVDPNDSSKFTVTLVHNSGAYAVSGWWWYYGVTSSQLVGYINQNQARLIDVQKYDTPYGPRFAAIMVSNTGAQARAWWWYHDVDVNSLATALTQNGARLTSLKSRTVGAQTLMTAIMVANSGSDATAWWWYVNVSPAFVSQKLGDNHARLIDYEHRPNGNLDVVMVQSTGEYWFWYYDVHTIGEVANLLGQRAARAIELEKYYVAGQARFAVLMIDNANAGTRAVERAYAAGVPSGAFGALTKRVGGSASVALQDHYVLDPASSLKVVHHLYALTTEPGNLDVPNLFSYWVDPSQPMNKDVCPNPAWEVDANRVDTTIRDGLTRMMQVSDNRATHGFELRYTRTTLNLFMLWIGMTDSEFKQIIGCGYQNGNRNDTTIADLAHVYEGVINGSLLSGSARDEFFGILLGGPVDPNSWIGDLVREEAAALGKSDAVAADFLSKMSTRSKGGSYDICGANCNSYEYVRSAAGRMTLPIHVTMRGQSPVRELVYGRFVTGLIIPCAPRGANETTAQAEARCPEYKAANAASLAAAIEQFRPEIRAALQTF